MEPLLVGGSVFSRFRLLQTVPENATILLQLLPIAIP